MTAPTLYHHFGNADGLVRSAVERGFEEFLARKAARPPTGDAGADLLDGWDDYVAFARERPRLYAAMIARLHAGGAIPAAARAHLAAKLERLAAEGRLRLSVAATADLVWATAHAAALLHVSNPAPPDPSVVAALRRAAEGVLSPAPKGPTT